jgi:peptidase E
MPSRRGVIALMGSGELTSTMVEVHKELLAGLGRSSRAVFLDTPAGFQLNADDLSRRALQYFQERVGRPMEVASLKSKESLSPYETEKAHRTLRGADFILIGPGSPTYAVSQWRNTPVPEILIQRIEAGACLVAASAAALTVGKFTLPVYEIYKVGQDLHWVEGMHLLDHFGLPLVVIPHWNNAEGGTHDTRFCYMGEPRFAKLESLLPSDASILGLDEHTACIMDLETGEARVRGIGSVTLRRQGQEIIFGRGERFPLDELRGGPSDGRPRAKNHTESAPMEEATEADDSFWRLVQAAEADFEQGLANTRPGQLVSALLELDRVIWRGHEDMESPEFIAQARERFREMVVQLGSAMEGPQVDGKECLAPLVEALLRLRERYRHENRWGDADALRKCLGDAGIVVEDAPDGVRWRSP